MPCLSSPLASCRFRLPCALPSLQGHKGSSPSASIASRKELLFLGSEAEHQASLFSEQLHLLVPGTSYRFLMFWVWKRQSNPVVMDWYLKMRKRMLSCKGSSACINNVILLPNFTIWSYCSKWLRHFSCQPTSLHYSVEFVFFPLIFFSELAICRPLYFWLSCNTVIFSVVPGVDTEFFSWTDLPINFSALYDAICLQMLHLQVCVFSFTKLATIICPGRGFTAFIPFARFSPHTCIFKLWISGTFVMNFAV